MIKREMPMQTTLSHPHQCSLCFAQNRSENSLVYYFCALACSHFVLLLYYRVLVSGLLRIPTIHTSSCVQSEEVFVYYLFNSVTLQVTRPCIRSTWTFLELRPNSQLSHRGEESTRATNTQIRKDLELHILGHECWRQYYIINRYLPRGPSSIIIRKHVALIGT